MSNSTGLYFYSFFVRNHYNFIEIFKKTEKIMQNNLNYIF